MAGIGIDIRGEPPADPCRNRGRHLMLAGVFLALSLAGVALMLYGMFSETAHGETLETVALGLFAAPAAVFSYFGGKVNACRGLSAAQKEELAGLARTHPEIAAYCGRVEKMGREPVFAEYEACRELGENDRG
ncbi:MAG: hypothetical protein AB1568_04040 [Thermodesulfobacteriota bacterium]